MLLLENIVNDRSSKYLVCGAPALFKAEALGIIMVPKKNRKYAKATLNTWAILLSDEGLLKNDDGEAGAGMVIVRMLEREQLFDHVIVVTRWYGGVQLGGDRFRRVQDCVAHYQEHRQ